MPITSAASLFEEWLGSIKPQSEWTKNAQITKTIENNIFWRVGCVKMSAPRHPRFEYFLGLGTAAIDQLFNGGTFESEVLTFMFPERYMSVHEQQRFTYEIGKHKDVGKIKRIDMLTSSPLVIGGFHREQIRILTWDDDDKHNGVS